MGKDILVLTATLGERRSLEETIRSVREIGGSNVTHIIISPEHAMQNIKDRYPDVECVAEPKDADGIYAVLNYGFRTFGKDYKYLCFLNDDDKWLPEYRTLIDAVASDDSLDLVYARASYVNEYGVKIGSQPCTSNFSKFIPLLKAGIVLMTQQATLIKSELFFRIGGFDESYRLVADTKFWAQVSLEDIKYRYINKECATYMIHSGQLSSDHDCQRNEHTRVLKEVGSGRNDILAPIMFRMANIPLYCKRLLRCKGHIRKPATGRVKQVLTTLLPWKIRRYVLNKYFLYDIAPTAHIGLSFIFPRFLRMREGASIGSLNVAINLDRMEMGKNSIISRGNWITGFPTGTDSPHFAHDTKRCSELIMGDECSITKNHHIDCTNSVIMGEFSAIGGYNTQILTHSVDMMECRQDSKPIIIGRYSLVATRSIVTGGAKLPAYSILCAGAYLGKPYEEEWKMYAGVPARPIKDIPKEAKRFHRTQGYIQ